MCIRDRFLSELESIDEIMCIEPDPRTFRHLSAFAESDPRCLAVNAAVGCENGKTVFMSSSSRASAAGGRNRRAKQVECDVIRIDETEIAKASVGRELFIKYDVEGGERDALIGSRETIARTMCPLSVALYHRTEDIFALPLLINARKPGSVSYTHLDVYNRQVQGSRAGPTRDSTVARPCDTVFSGKPRSTAPR